MRKRIIALLMLVCMTVSNISPAYAYIGGKITKTDILQNKDDTYILENYAKSLKEAQDVLSNLDATKDEINDMYQKL